MRVLKNLKRITFKTHFRGRDIFFKSKSSKIFDFNEEEERAEYYFWINLWPEFLIDITSRPDIKAKFEGGESK